MTRARKKKNPVAAPCACPSCVLLRKLDEPADAAPAARTVNPRTCGGLVTTGTLRRLVVVRPDGSSHRPNPAPLGKIVRVDLEPHQMRPRWVPLRRAGKWNRRVRDFLRGKTGVYAVRKAGEKRTTLYVGESHTGHASKDPHRFMRTLLRHFQAGFEPHGQPSEWTYRGSDDLEVALWVTPPSRAREVEGKLVLELEPSGQSLGRYAAAALDFNAADLEAA